MESKLCSSFANKANPITINCSTPTSLFCWLLCSCHCHIPHLPKKFTVLGSSTLVHSRSYPTPLKAQNLSGSQFYADLISPVHLVNPIITNAKKKLVNKRKLFLSMPTIQTVCYVSIFY